MTPNPGRYNVASTSGIIMRRALIKTWALLAICLWVPSAIAAGPAEDIPLVKGISSAEQAQIIKGIQEDRRNVAKLVMPGNYVALQKVDVVQVTAAIFHLGEAYTLPTQREFSDLIEHKLRAAGLNAYSVMERPTRIQAYQSLSMIARIEPCGPGQSVCLLEGKLDDTVVSEDLAIYFQATTWAPSSGAELSIVPNKSVKAEILRMAAKVTDEFIAEWRKQKREPITPMRESDVPTNH